MDRKFGVNILIEREKIDGRDIFIASSPDVNVFAEGNSIDEAKKKFLEGLRIHLDTFPKEKTELMVKQEDEMPMMARVFL